MPTHQIHEVFYDNHYDVIGYEKSPAVAFGDITEELYENFCEMMKAFDEVPLNLDHVDYLLKVKKVLKLRVVTQKKQQKNIKKNKKT